MADIKQVYVVYALLRSGERYALAAYNSLEKAKRHADRGAHRECDDSLSPAEILGIEGFQIVTMEVR